MSEQVLTITPYKKEAISKKIWLSYNLDNFTYGKIYKHRDYFFPKVPFMNLRL